MDEEKILEELTPPEERKRFHNVNRCILEAVAKRGISYPSEIVGDTELSRQTVFDHIRILTNRGKLVRVSLKDGIPDDLRNRLLELWERGLKGGMLRRMSWYRVKKEG